MNVAVIGSGTMGNGIAHVFAQHGFSVALIDISQPALDRALGTITKNLDRQVAKATLSEDDKTATLGRLKTFTSLAEGVAGAELVVEAATENVDLKLQIFRDLDQHAPAEAILASNTSSISITKIAAVTRRPAQVIGMHFMNPVPVMKLVEVIRGYATSDAVTARVMDLSRQLGKTPTEVNDYPGFVANRILMPMINEAIITLFEGVAGVEEIDTVMKLGFGRNLGADATMTAGNSTPLTDGASTVLLASDEWADARDLPKLAAVVDAEAAAVDFVHGKDGLLMAPVFAVPRLLARHNLTLADIDYFEIHEAFAATVLSTLAAWEDEDFGRTRLGLDGALGKVDRSRLNVNGSSLAAGHPFAATGGRIVASLAKLLHAKGSTDGRPARGLVSVCAAGGQGVVAILESV